MDIGAIVIIMVIGLVLVITFYIIGLYNKLIDCRNRVEDQFTSIELELRKKASLIPNLVESVKIYAKHEDKLLTDVMNVKSRVDKANKINDIIKASNNMNVILNKVFLLSNTYPELKKNKNYLLIRKDLDDIEDRINYARTFYNDVVLNYNNSIMQFPSNVVAKFFKFKEIDYYK